MAAVTTTTAGIYVVSDSKTETGTLASTGDIVNVNCEAYDRASVQITNTAGGSTFIFQVSNDGSNWVNVAGYAPSAPATETVVSTTSTGMTVFRLDAKFFKVNISVYAAGTASVTVHLRALYTAD
jgi:hypothetical protein